MADTPPNGYEKRGFEIVRNDIFGWYTSKEGDFCIKVFGPRFGPTNGFRSVTNQIFWKAKARVEKQNYKRKTLAQASRLYTTLQARRLPAQAGAR